MNKKIILLSVLSAIFLSACGKSENAEASAVSVGALAPDDWVDAAGKFVDRNNVQIGAVLLKNAPGAGVLMRLQLRNIEPGWHGIHLHQIGDCSDFADGFKASGGHVDPENTAHGFLNPDGFERADLANIFVGNDGAATVEFFNGTVALYPSEAAAAEAGPYPLMDADGFAIVVHENADDHITQPIGGAGGRIACAAVGG